MNKTIKKMKQIYQIFSNAKWSLMMVAVLSMCVISACKKDDDDDDGGDGAPVASFQYEVSASDYLTVSFTNYSTGATGYSWDFGDGNSSTEENPTHTYSEAGTYDIVLTASKTGASSSSFTETLTLTDPNEALSLLAGDGSKTWYLQREGVALGVGPGIDDTQWWGFGANTPLGDRPCILDDQYIFHQDGTFEYVSNGTIFIDAAANGGWLDGSVAESCFEDSPTNLTSVNGEDLSAYGDGGDYTYEYDATAGSLTLNGEGAFIGLPNKNENPDSYLPVGIKSYTVFALTEGDVADSLKIALVASNGDHWNFYLVSYANESDLPAIPSAVPTAGFFYEKNGNEVSFTNTSTNANSYTWDFGDGASSTEENPVHTYPGEGDYVVTLTASDGMTSVDYSETITLSTAGFTGAVLSNADGKTWNLAGAGSYFVGPAPGSPEWWPGPAEGERLCQMDDEFIFTDGGNYSYQTLGETWAEAYMGVAADGCTADGDIPAPFDVLGSNDSHSFEVMEGSDTEPAFITVNGEGAFIGFSKPINGGELDVAAGITPVSSITYQVLDYTSTPEKETITLGVDIAGDGTAWWTIIIESLN